MPVNKIVVNASPLILLCNCELEAILPALFGEIVVPAAVWQEIQQGPNSDRAKAVLPTLSWLKAVAVTADPAIIRWDLGVGETEVLSLAHQQGDYTPFWMIC